MPWRDNHKAKHAAYMREWRKTHRLTAEQRRKDNCRSYAGIYLRNGKLTREPCFVCDAPAQMHHPDYSQPLLVVWLCRAHHLMWHRLEIVPQESICTADM